MIDKRKELLSIVEKAEREICMVEKMPFRHRFHIMPPVGWLNDPNGLCYFKGWYHVFFQYSPEDAAGGTKFWGHYRSRNMCDWEYLGVPLMPDLEEDRDGVYSGSALVDDGIIEIFYTGNVKEQGNFDYIRAGREANIIYLFSEDGVHFSKKEILLTNKDYPKECSNHVRDPKVWKEKDMYYMVLGARTLEDVGMILLYESKNKKKWTFQKKITTDEKFGYMWECPDVFYMNDLKILMCCPQGVKAERYRYQNIYQAGYFRYKEHLNDFIEWDMGFDFYAPQTFLDQDKKRILIGWAGIPDAPYKNLSTEEGWQHSLTIPRELYVKNHQIYQKPFAALTLCHRKKHTLTRNENMIMTQSFDLQIEYFDEIQTGFSFGEDLVFQCDRNEIKLEFQNNTGAGRTIRRAKSVKINQIRVLYDISLVEIFINDGELVFTTRYYPEQHDYTRIKLFGEFDNAQLWEVGDMFEKAFSNRRSLD